MVCPICGVILTNPQKVLGLKNQEMRSLHLQFAHFKPLLVDLYNYLILKQKDPKAQDLLSIWNCLIGAENREWEGEEQKNGNL
jgi:hypothetical protein